MGNKKGSILMISLWILTILVLFAIGLGHRAMINLRLSRYQRDRLKAYYLAKAGVNRAIVEIMRDLPDYDSLNDKWAKNEEVFKEIKFGDNQTEFATVSYDTIDENNNPQTIYGVIDEERKININTAFVPNIDQSKFLSSILKECQECEFNEEQANTLAKYIRIWRGDTAVDLNRDAPEYKNFKKALFTNSEELLIVLEYFYQSSGEENYQKKAQEVYIHLKDLITVYPVGGTLQINANTASEDVLTILAKSIAGNDEEKNCASAVVEDIIKQRDERNYFKTKGDIEIRDVISGISSDQDLFGNLLTYLGVSSNNFKIQVKGNIGRVTKKITAIYDRINKKIVSWQQN